MCILFLAINQHPHYPLIVAANRDESFTRPSQPMHQWQDNPRILAGRDSLKGGSWLGVNLDGQFCAVTNFRTGKPANKDTKSRGQLVQHYLSHEKTDEDFIAYLQNTRQQYSPFNLVFGTPENVRVFCSTDSSLLHLKNGFHSLSNGKTDQHWPKMSHGVQQLSTLITENSTINIDRLNAVMRDETQANDHELPNTGVSRHIEKQLSSIFIRATDHILGYADSYGTRTTSYLLYSSKHIQLIEFNYNRAAAVIDQQRFTLICP